jgi:hypothetical protein
VPELTHDTAEDGFHEIQLSGKQLVFLFMTATIVSVFIFLCGVLVGRGARDAGAIDPAQTSTVASNTPAVTTDAGPPAAEPPAPAESADDLSYHRRLQGEGAPAESLKKPADEPAPAAVPAPAPEPPAKQPAATVPQRTPAAADVPTSGRPGSHVIQLFASRDQAVAAKLVKQLNSKGYPAFLVAPESRSVPQTYKVQVGRYSEREAEQVARQLAKEGDFKPWIVSR